MSEGQEGRAALRNRSAELGVAAFFLALGAIVIYDSARLGVGWGEDGPRPGYFPFYVGLIICISALVNAARAMGLSASQSMRFIVMPQAMRLIVPTLGNSINGLLKTTSVTSVISMEELLRRTQVLIQEKFMVLELFVVAALYYLLMTTAWDFIQRRIERHYGRAYRTNSAAAVPVAADPALAQR